MSSVTFIEYTKMHQSFINAILFALADRNGFDYMGNRSVAIKMFVNDFHNAQSIKSGYS